MDYLLGLVPLDWLGELFQAELTRLTFLFFIAAEIHKRHVKKEFALLRGSIDHVAAVMEKKYDDHESRLRALEQEGE